MAETFTLQTHPVHLGRNAQATVQPEFAPSFDWYVEYGQRVATDGHEGRLISLHTMSSDWDTWEMHPHGDEVVVCLSGQVTLHQQSDDETQTAVLGPGQGVINKAGVWHTADINTESRVLFITAGAGTQHRPRTAS